MDGAQAGGLMDDLLGIYHITLRLSPARQAEAIQWVSKNGCAVGATVFL